MSDVELLLLPQHTVRQRLHQIIEAADHRHTDTATWLEKYFYSKYLLRDTFDNEVDESLSVDQRLSP
jgi:hypothetical protein